MNRIERIALRAKSEVTSARRTIGRTDYLVQLRKADLEQAGRDFFEGKGNWS